MRAPELQRMNEVISENRALKSANEELRQAVAAARKWMDGFDSQMLNAPQREPATMRLYQEDEVQSPRPRIYTWSEGFIGWIGSGYNSRGQFPSTLSELSADLAEYRHVTRVVRA